jgi:hypothetical protein
MGQAGSAWMMPARSSTSYGTPYWARISMSCAEASSCCWVRNSWVVPRSRPSNSMPICARSSFRQSRLYSDMRTMRALLIA